MRLRPLPEDGLGALHRRGPADPGSRQPLSGSRSRGPPRGWGAAGTRRTRTPLRTGARQPVAGRRPRVKSWGVGARRWGGAGRGGRAGSPGPGGVPGGRQARRRLEAKGLASLCLESSESDRRLRLSARVPAGASGSKWQKEAERLGPAALASTQLAFGVRQTEGAWGQQGAGGRGLEFLGVAPTPASLAVWSLHPEGGGRRLR